MNILQFFHKKKTLPMFNLGDRVRLRKDPLTILPLYNKEYPNCAMSNSDFIEGAWGRLKRELGTDEHIVTGIMEGTIAAGGWFVAVDKPPLSIYNYYHGNIFELI